MKRELKFSADPGCWTSKDNTDPRLWEFINAQERPTRAEMDKTIKLKKHIYRAHKLSRDVLLLIAYDDISLEPIRCVVNPDPKHPSNTMQ